MPEQLTSLVEEDAQWAYKLSLEVFESDSRPTALRDQFFRQMRERPAIQAGNFPSGSNSQQECRNASRSTNRLVMGLNFKNGETCLLSLDLARLTGETLAGTITVALRERLSGRSSDSAEKCLGPDPHAPRPWQDEKQSTASPQGKGTTGRSLSRPFRHRGHSAAGSLCEGSFKYESRSANNAGPPGKLTQPRARPL